MLKKLFAIILVFSILYTNTPFKTGGLQNIDIVQAAVHSDYIPKVESDEFFTEGDTRYIRAGESFIVNLPGFTFTDPINWYYSVTGDSGYSNYGITNLNRGWEIVIPSTTTSGTLWIYAYFPIDGTYGYTLHYNIATILPALSNTLHKDDRMIVLSGYAPSSPSVGWVSGYSDTSYYYWDPVDYYWHTWSYRPISTDEVYHYAVYTLYNGYATNVQSLYTYEHGYWVSVVNVQDKNYYNVEPTPHGYGLSTYSQTRYTHTQTKDFYYAGKMGDITLLSRTWPTPDVSNLYAPILSNSSPGVGDTITVSENAPKQGSNSVYGDAKIYEVKIGNGNWTAFASGSDRSADFYVSSAANNQTLSFRINYSTATNMTGITATTTTDVVKTAVGPGGADPSTYIPVLPSTTTTVGDFSGTCVSLFLLIIKPVFNIDVQTPNPQKPHNS
ncbi:MAG: hypothetical protein LBL34_04640, partial [Clostridiales bacterium]|nr:hypothetical protein [Clostridiales bacterium]